MLSSTSKTISTKTNYSINSLLVPKCCQNFQILSSGSNNDSSHAQPYVLGYHQPQILLLRMVSTLVQFIEVNHGLPSTTKYGMCGEFSNHQVGGAELLPGQWWPQSWMAQPIFGLVFSLLGSVVSGQLTATLSVQRWRQMGAGEDLQTSSSFADWLVDLLGPVSR